MSNSIVSNRIRKNLWESSLHATVPFHKVLLNSDWLFRLLSYPPVTSYGAPLATWLVVREFSQVVSMSALQAQGHGFIPNCDQ